jgi:hypothetical protein
MKKYNLKLSSENNGKKWITNFPKKHFTIASKWQRIMHERVVREWIEDVLLINE